jgi:hypothetical protein
MDLDDFGTSSPAGPGHAVPLPPRFPSPYQPSDDTRTLLAQVHIAPDQFYAALGALAAKRPLFVGLEAMELH